jgi:hypothetical protein
MFPCFFISLLSPVDNGSLTDYYSRGCSPPAENTRWKRDICLKQRCLINYFFLFTFQKRIQDPIRETSKIEGKIPYYFTL